MMKRDVDVCWSINAGMMMMFLSLFVCRVLCNAADQTGEFFFPYTVIVYMVDISSCLHFATSAKSL